MCNYTFGPITRRQIVSPGHPIRMLYVRLVVWSSTRRSVVRECDRSIIILIFVENLHFNSIFKKINFHDKDTRGGGGGSGKGSVSSSSSVLVLVRVSIPGTCSSSQKTTREHQRKENRRKVSRLVHRKSSQWLLICNPTISTRYWGAPVMPMMLL
jgi:hypothetical protein